MNLEEKIKLLYKTLTEVNKNTSYGHEAIVDQEKIRAVLKATRPTRTKKGK